MTLPADSDSSVLEQLAERICAFRPDHISRRALDRSLLAIADTIGVTLAGLPEPAAQILLRTSGIAEAPGPAPIFGTAIRTTMLDAAFVNAVASHALDYDDFSRVMGGHQSVPLVAPLFAVAEARKLTGRQLVTAYVIGVEVEIRLARALTQHHYDKGWHPTSTIGVFGAAAAVSHLSGLTPEGTATALAIAASCASGLKANFGTMTKPLHAGRCARDGLQAALLAEGGYSANPGAMEHRQGFFSVYNGTEFDAGLLFENWCAPLEIEADHISIKEYACCGSTHSAVAMALALHGSLDLDHHQISRIEIMPHRRRLRHTDTPFPRDALESKFSVQYAVARALAAGTVRLRDFEGDAFADPDIDRLLKITHAVPHPDMPDDAAEQWGAEVAITLADGQRHARRSDGFAGLETPTSMAAPQIRDKFEDCASRVLAGEQIERLYSALAALDTLDDVSTVTRLMHVDAPAVA